MAKKIYWETVKPWAIKLGIPSGSLVGLLFLYLTFLGAIDITGFSGDQVCAGTINDPCYAYVNFTANEDIFIYPVGYDPWGRDTIFEFSPGLKDWKLQRSWGTGWRDIPLNKTCTGTWCGAPDNNGVAYSYVLREDRDYQFRVVAYKNNPQDFIKWAVNYKDKEYLDPAWLPTQNYTIDGDKVYFNDSRVYIEVYPHTARNGEWVTFNFTSKIYSGDVDVVLGFDKSEMKAEGVRKYNPTNETRQKSYICGHEFNYTLSPKYATCYLNISTTNNQTQETSYSTEILFNGEFETGNIAEKTVYWTEEYIDEYKTISNNVFNSINYTYGDINKWYYYNDLTIEQGVANAYQIKIKSVNPWGTKSKYWFGIKPSNLTIQEAIEQDKFYAIDPWTEELNVDLVSYWKFDEITGTTAYDELGTNNLTTNAAAIFTNEHTGIINTDADLSSGINHLKVASGLETSSVWAISMWMNSTITGGVSQYIIDTRGSTGATGYLQFRESSGNLQFVDGSNSGKTLDAIGDVFDSTWHHVVLVIDGTSLQYYLDGSQVGSNISISLTSFGTAEDVVFGGIRTDGGAGTVAYQGQFDEMAIWDRFLTASEISSLWNSGDGITWTDDFGSFPVLTANITKPDTVYTNTDWLINLTANDENHTYIDSYVQFYVNDSSVGDVQTFNMTNNTNHLVATLGSGNFSAGNTLIAEVWLGNGENNLTKVNLTETVQYFNITGTLKDGDANNLNATVFVVNQTDDSLVGNTTSLNGVWTFGPVAPGTYIITGYDPSNSTLDGDAEPRVVVP